MGGSRSSGVTEAPAAVALYALNAASACPAVGVSPTLTYLTLVT